jgi:hypothetical protein
MKLLGLPNEVWITILGNLDREEGGVYARLLGNSHVPKKDLLNFSLVSKKTMQLALESGTAFTKLYEQKLGPVTE